MARALLLAALLAEGAAAAFQNFGRDGAQVECEGVGSLPPVEATVGDQHGDAGGDATDDTHSEFLGALLQPVALGVVAAGEHDLVADPQRLTMEPVRR